MPSSKSSNSWLQVSTHLLALIVGGGLVFGGMRLFSSSETAPTSSSQSAVTTDSQTTARARQSIPDPDDLADSFVSAAVDRVSPAVVQINTIRIITRDPSAGIPAPFERFFGEQFIPPRQRRQQGQGSGFIIDSDGTIVTNAHVVSGADRVQITLQDGRSFDGRVMGTDAITDLAVVKIQTEEDETFPTATLGDSSQIEVGDWAIAVGNPFGLESTVTLGIISTTERSSAQAGIPDKRLDFFQTDAAINPGNSGGPLVNANGEVIGINTAIRANATGIGFAIPINTAKQLQDTLARGEQVPHPYVGIRMITLTPEVAKRNNEDPNSRLTLPETKGVLVVEVVPNTPADRAGLEQGDVILQVAGQRVEDAEQLQDLVEKSGVSETITFKIQRGDRELEVEVTTAQLETSS